MPDDPNKQMDEMLRAYARERRKGPDIPLHQATRNLLQAEANRVFGRSERAIPWWRNLCAVWPHLAFGGGLCLVFGIAVLSLRQPSRTLEEGRTESGAASQVGGKEMLDLSKQVKKAEKPVEAREGEALSSPAPLLPAEPKAAPADIPQLNEVDRQIAPEQKLKERVVTQSAPPRAAARTSVGREAQEKRETEEALALKVQSLPDAAATADSGEIDSSLQRRAKAPAPTTLPKSTATASADSKRTVRDEETASTANVRARGLAAAESQTRADQLSNLSAARRLNFVQVPNAPVSAGAPVNVAPPSTVLTSFQLEQNGTNLRVLDRDGSIYLGALKPTNVAATVALKDDKAQIDNSLAYFFRVQGTNRTLNSDVVLTGNYFEQTNATPTEVQAFSIIPQAGQRQQQNQARYLIIGNATVGNTSEVPVRAVSTSP